METLELLAPAGSADIGIAAVNHGADAVYIGGPAFSARAAAGNSLAELERLVRYAHLFRAKVYIALNTIFNDAELEEAVALCHRYYELGADALIIQDFGLLECDLPPLPLHASTQMNNRTAEKVAFLEATGFQQVVLARELSLTQIREIAAATTVSLEFFVHGALCVSYSGQCYISEVMCGRSANRGECAQFCRHAFTLRRKNGEVLATNRHLLSLQDLNLSGRLELLSAAGIRSFKIEGRLKDENYVKNVTAVYRKELDRILTTGDFIAASAGQCTFSFAPDAAKSFHRGGTDYYLLQKRNSVAEPRTPKATGEFLGRVEEVAGKMLRLQEPVVVNSGDGLCCFVGERLAGARINRVDGDRILLNRALGCSPGTKIYRNVDSSFSREIQQSTTPRKLAIRMSCAQQEGRIVAHVLDEDGIKSSVFLPINWEEARQPGQAERAARRQLVKTGGTPFIVTAVEIRLPDNLFLPVASLNELRRLALEKHCRQREVSYVRQDVACIPSTAPWPEKRVGVRDNIGNGAARRFYRRHGAVIDTELVPKNVSDLPLMQTRYCVKFQLGMCPKVHGKQAVIDPSLVLSDQQASYELTFDCLRCEMMLRKLP